jgi:hypothetical protein
VREDVLETAAEAAGPLVDAERLKPIARLGKNLYTRLGPIFALDRPRIPRA